MLRLCIIACISLLIFAVSAAPLNQNHDSQSVSSLTDNRSLKLVQRGEYGDDVSSNNGDFYGEDDGPNHRFKYYDEDEGDDESDYYGEDIGPDYGDYDGEDMDDYYGEDDGPRRYYRNRLQNNGVQYSSNNIVTPAAAQQKQA
jgi:hypothetical protein